MEVKELVNWVKTKAMQESDRKVCLEMCFVSAGRKSVPKTNIMAAQGCPFMKVSNTYTKYILVSLASVNCKSIS